MEEDSHLQPNLSFTKEDRISRLPSDILKVILACLPTIDAGRTCLLSRRWRYEWTSFPNLIFDRDAVTSSLYRKLVEIVNHVLLLHKGPIHRFSYDHLSKRNLPNMEEWLLILSRNGIKELKCSFNIEAVCKLPSTLFLYQQLTCLELCYVKIDLPLAYNGFESLVSLHLEFIFITDDDFAFLISMCPLLRKLVFRRFYECHHLKIDAPNLYELEVIGPFHDLDLENSPLLAILSVGLEADADVVNKFHGNFIRSLKGLLRLESLHLGSNTIQSMTEGNAVGVFPTYNYLLESLHLGSNAIQSMTKGNIVGGFPTYNYLKRLCIRFFNFQDENQVLILRCLLQSSPILQEIHILADMFYSMDNHPSYCVGREWSDTRFDHLKELVVLGQAQTDLEFIKCVLANAPVLELLELKLDLTFDKDIKAYEQIMQFRRSSTLSIFCSDY